MAHDADKESAAVGLLGILGFMLLLVGLVAAFGWSYGVVTPTTLHNLATFR